MSASLKCDFQRKKTITFFWSKLSQLHKKDQILHVTTTFSLKQGETRTNSVPIPHSLKLFLYFCFWFLANTNIVQNNNTNKWVRLSVCKELKLVKPKTGETNVECFAEYYNYLV